MIMASAAKEFKMDNFSPKAGTSKLQQTVPADASPDSKCPICLDRFDNVSYLDRCLHKFCFRCVQEWSKNKAECPLCKQPFDSIFHSVRAEDDFKEYVLRPSYNGSFTNPEVRRFRYRTTMTRTRSLSVEIVYEGKATDTSKHHKKKKKKHKKKHKKHHGDNTSRSPVVITIDSDSDGESEVKAGIECSNGSLPQPIQDGAFETKDVVTIEDELGVLDKDCDVTALADDLSTSQTVENCDSPAVPVEQTLDVREESTFASDLESQSSNVSIQAEPSRPVPSPRTSLSSVSPGRDCDVS